MNSGSASPRRDSSSAASQRRDGSTLTFSYDALNRVTVKTVPERAGLAAAHTRDVYYGYDLRGLQTYARFDSASGEGVTNGYDGFGRLTSSSNTMGGITRTLGYGHDANGNRLTLTWPDSQITTYSYDRLNRMIGVHEGAGTSVVMASMHYLAQGQRGSLARRYGDTSAYGYDGIGRLSAMM